MGKIMKQGMSVHFMDGFLKNGIIVFLVIIIKP